MCCIDIGVSALCDCFESTTGVLCATASLIQQVRYDYITGAVYNKYVMIIHQIVKLDMLLCVLMSISVLVGAQRRPGQGATDSRSSSGK